MPRGLIKLMLLAVVVIAFVVGLAIGAQILSSSTTKVTPLAPVRHHPCPSSSTAKGFYMQCVGPETPNLIAPPDKNAPPKRGTFQTLPGPTPPSAGAGGFGVDFAWSRPPAYIARAGGAHFGAGYLSGGTSKDFFNAGDYRAHGLGVVFVWETAAARSLAGYNAGYSDAYNATHEAQRLGFRSGHIDFATDVDTTGRYDFVPYYQGAAAWDRRAGFTTGAYGGLNTVRTLCQRGITTANWQTIAWSYGYWMPASCAPLRQTSINSYWHGYSVDYDYAVAAYYGQSTAPPVPPKPRIVCFGKHAQTQNALCKRVHKQVRRWQGAEAASLSVYRARGCPGIARRRHALAQHPKRNAKALRAARREFSGHRCPVFAARASYFQGQIRAIERKYR